MMRHIYDRLDHIATPRDGMANCSTHDHYVHSHEAEMKNKQRAFPALGFRSPWVATDGAQPLVAGGKWVVICECGDAPMASPEWNEARCFGCGAIYRHLRWPEDRLTIERVLTSRPSALSRNWLPDESVQDLRAQNSAHGVIERIG